MESKETKGYCCHTKIGSESLQKEKFGHQIRPKRQGHRQEYISLRIREIVKLSIKSHRNHINQSKDVLSISL